MKSVKILNSRSENLDLILSSGQSSSNRYDLGFDSSVKNTSQTTRVKFVPASVNIEFELPAATKAVSFLPKGTSQVCHYCGKRGYIRPFCYFLQRDELYQRKDSNHSQRHKSNSLNQNGRRSYKVWRVKQSEIVILLLHQFQPQLMRGILIVDVLGTLLETDLSFF